MIRAHDGVIRPGSLADALAELGAAPPGTKLLAGGTDLYVQWGQGAALPERVIDLWACASCGSIALAGDVLAVGALATHARIAASPDVRAARASARGGVRHGRRRPDPEPRDDRRQRRQQRRRPATRCPCSSPRRRASSWRAPRVASGRSRPTRSGRRVPPDGAARRRDRRPRGGPVPGWPAVFRKVGTRRAQAISKVVLCCARERRGAGASPVRVAFGAWRPSAARGGRRGAALERPARRRPHRRRLRRARRDLTPIDDVRSTAAYRMHVARAIATRAARSAGVGLAVSRQPLPSPRQHARPRARSVASAARCERANG